MLRKQTGRTSVAVVAGLALAAITACGGADAANDSADTGAAMGAASGDTGAMAAAPGGATGGAMDDNAIIGQMSGANGAEIAAGQAAQEKAQNADVKQFAAQMVTDHQAMQGQVDSLVTRLNVQRAPVPDSIQQHMDQARQQLTGQAAGAEFDRLYMDMQVTDHQNTLNALNAARTAAQNADLRALVEQAIPKVQAHLDQARKIREGLGGGAG